MSMNGVLWCFSLVSCIVFLCLCLWAGATMAMHGDDWEDGLVWKAMETAVICFAVGLAIVLLCRAWPEASRCPGRCQGPALYARTRPRRFVRTGSDAIASSFYARIALGRCG